MTLTSGKERKRLSFEMRAYTEDLQRKLAECFGHIDINRKQANYVLQKSMNGQEIDR